MGDIIRARAAGLQPFGGTVLMADAGPMTVDVNFPQTPNKHYVVELCSFMGKFTVQGPSTSGGFPPNTGLFLVPINTPIESLADATTGMNFQARNTGILLPMGPPGANVATIGGAAGFPFSFALTLAAGTRITVPYQWTIRAIITCLAGNAAPGPGVNSQGIILAMATQEDDHDLATDLKPWECR